jgi:hypothetical protein
MGLVQRKETDATACYLEVRSHVDAQRARGPRALSTVYPGTPRDHCRRTTHSICVLSPLHTTTRIPGSDSRESSFAAAAAAVRVTKRRRSLRHRALSFHRIRHVVEVPNGAQQITGWVWRVGKLPPHLAGGLPLSSPPQFHPRSRHSCQGPPSAGATPAPARVGEVWKSPVSTRGRGQGLKSCFGSPILRGATRYQKEVPLNPSDLLKFWGILKRRKRSFQRRQRTYLPRRGHNSPGHETLLLRASPPR